MVLSYHNIAEKKGFYTLSYEQFEEQILYLREHNKIVSVDEYVKHILHHGKSEEGAAVITFDDAFVSYADMVVPLLKEWEVPSALFVCTGYLGKSNEWNDEAHRSPIMEARTVKKLSEDKLVTIGAHTVSHPPLAQLQRQVAYFELDESKKYLEELIGRKVDYVAYPYGQPYHHVNQMVSDLAKDLGYRAAFSTNNEVANRKSQLYKMNRIDIGPEDDMEVFKLKLVPDNHYVLEQRKKNRDALIHNFTSGFISR